jgi:hypothetical protein
VKLWEEVPYTMKLSINWNLMKLSINWNLINFIMC